MASKQSTRLGVDTSSRQVSRVHVQEWILVRGKVVEYTFRCVHWLEASKQSTRLGVDTGSRQGCGVHV